MKCPQCSHVCDVFLSKKASVIILTCPSCTSPMLYFDNQVFVLSENQMETIRSTRHSWAIMRIMEHIKHTQAALSGFNQNFGEAVRTSEPESAVPAPRPSDIEKYITEDDVTNLRIELELCKDSQQFIDRLVN
jgi:hypothetical protein